MDVRFGMAMKIVDYQAIVDQRFKVYDTHILYVVREVIYYEQIRT